MTKLFFKNPIFMVWVAFCLTYLFFKSNMYISYLLFMIMIPFNKYTLHAEIATTQRKGVYLHIYYLHLLQNSMMIS